MKNEIDKFKLYRGEDVVISDKIIVTQPTIEQVLEFGEAKYFNSVHNFVSVGADMKWQLYDYFNIDYTKIPDYELFVQIIAPMISSRKKEYLELKNNPDKQDELVKYTKEELDDMLINPLKLILKDIDLADFMVYTNTESQQIVLYNKEEDILIDKLTYLRMVEVVREIHGLKRNNQLPGNESTKMVLIDDDREEYQMSLKKPTKSMLRSLVSFMEIFTGQYGSDVIWKQPIGKFLYDIKRAQKMIDADHMLMGAYCGFSDMKKVEKSKFDYMGEIE